MPMYSSFHQCSCQKE